MNKKYSNLSKRHTFRRIQIGCSQQSSHSHIEAYLIFWLKTNNLKKKNLINQDQTDNNILTVCENMKTPNARGFNFDLDMNIIAI